MEGRHNRSKKETYSLTNKEYADIIKEAKQYKNKADRYNISVAYIADQTGLSKKEVTSFWKQMADAEEVTDKDNEKGTVDFNVDHKKIYEKMKLFFSAEDTFERYEPISDKAFKNDFELLKEEFSLTKPNPLADKLRKKFKWVEADYRVYDGADQWDEFTEYCIKKYDIDPNISQKKQIKEITQQIDPLYSRLNMIKNDLLTDSTEKENLEAEMSTIEDEISKLDMQIMYLIEVDDLTRRAYKEYLDLTKDTSVIGLKYSKAKRMKESRSAINYHNMEKDSQYSFNAYQQMVITEFFLELSLDKNGYILPDHFGTAIQLCTSFRFHMETFRGFIRHLEKVSCWATLENLSKYDINTPIPKVDSSDPVYKVIYTHQRVFFHDPCHKALRKIAAALNAATTEERRKLRYMLAEEFGLMQISPSKMKEYCQLVSEYLDIVALRKPIAELSEHSDEEIYRIVYETAEASEGRITFTNELVDEVLRCINFKPARWRWEMYFACYYFTHKELDSLVRYIERLRDEPQIY